MMYKVLSAAALLAVGVAQAANWAVLVAGSNQWSNYRHQADVAHAYQILTHKGGFPASHVITMAFDDIANNPSNLKKGQIFNKPNGPDVYNGLVIDYKGTDVNAANFLKVLSGDKAGLAGVGSGKVLQSTAYDNVFVYYADHGAFGFVGMPTGSYLYAHDLNATLNTMSSKRMFKKLAFYMEACESGSMFDSILSTHENIWAVTAANPKESSYATYYDKTVGNFLGDEFSVRWMEDSDVEKLVDSSYTVEKQFELVQTAVKQSHVMKYGEADMGALPVGEFQLFNKFDGSASTAVADVVAAPEETANGTDVRQVEIEVLKRRIADAKTEEEKMDLEILLQEEMTKRSTTDDLFAKIVAIVTQNYGTVDHPDDAPRDFVCLKNAVEEFEAKCGSLQGYGFKYGRTIAALCDLGYGFDAIKSAIGEVCPASMIL